MATLIRTAYSIDAIHTVGTPMLVNSPVTSYSVDQTVPVTVFGPFTGADFIADPYNFSPTYPLLMKLFFSNVVMTGTVAYPTPEYIVQITGPFNTMKIHQYDEKNFGVTCNITNWALKAVNVVVSIIPIPPLTGVSLQCFAGIATENVQDASAEF
jgi:hypothetical protein